MSPQLGSQSTAPRKPLDFMRSPPSAFLKYLATLLSYPTVKIVVYNDTESEEFDVPRKVLFLHSAFFKDLVQTTPQNMAVSQGGIEPWLFRVFDDGLRRPHDSSKRETWSAFRSRQKVLRKRQRNGRSVGFQGICWQDLFALYKFAATYTEEVFQRAVVMDLHSKFNSIKDYVVESLPDSKGDVVRTITQARLSTFLLQQSDISDLESSKLNSWAADIVSLSRLSGEAEEILPTLVLRSLRAYLCADCKDPNKTCQATDHLAGDSERPFRRLKCDEPWCKHDKEEDAVVCSFRRGLQRRELRDILLW